MQKKLICTAALFIATSLLTFAEYNSYGIPDSTEIRRSITESWFKAPLDDLRAKPSEIRPGVDGTNFQIRMEEKMDTYAVIVSPESLLNVEVVRNEEKSAYKMPVYPEGAPGSFVLFRDKASGRPCKIDWYFNADSDVYLELVPSKNKTYANLIVCTSYASKSVPLGMDFERMYGASFSEIQKWTSSSVAWNKVKVVPGQYKDSLQMAYVIREKLDLITYAEDACYDQNYKLCNISTGKDYVVRLDDGTEYIPDTNGHLFLSGAGFVKWICDGIIEPVTGKASFIKDIVEPTVEYNVTGKKGKLSPTYDLSFTLDWCRNLAAKCLSVRSSRSYDWNVGGVDVVSQNFAAENVNGRLVNTTGYITNSGYSAKKIKSLLYVLAVTEPGCFYLCAIKQNSNLRADESVFNNCAVLFPYFDDAGHFDCIVFEMGKEVKFYDFVNNYFDSYLHLERVKATSYFFPAGPEDVK